MNISQIPKPILFASMLLFSMVALYGAQDIFGNDKSITNTESSEVENTKMPELKKVRLMILDDETKKPVVAARVIVSSTVAPNDDQTDSSGYIQVRIPSNEDVKVNIYKDGYNPESYNMNLQNNPDIPKTIYLKKININNN
jgi:hypothetical protein